jgi:hypothetical protein
VVSATEPHGRIVDVLHRITLMLEDNIQISRREQRRRQLTIQSVYLSLLSVLQAQIFVVSSVTQWDMTNPFREGGGRFRNFVSY